MEENEKKYFLETIKSVKYDHNAFMVRYSNDKVVFGIVSKDLSSESQFFVYKSIYDSILDADINIKFSLMQAIRIVDSTNFQKWNPILPPSKDEKIAIYYIENAIFRTEILWDLLAQLVNIKEKMNTPTDKIYAKTLFNNACQKDPNSFVTRVYAYMDQKDNTESDTWEGNYEYIKTIRNKLTHRNSPNISTVSNFNLNLRDHPIYILKRLVDDYKQVSVFVLEYISKILTECQQVFDCRCRDWVINKRYSANTKKIKRAYLCDLFNLSDN